jgi:hypothetical protein
VLNARTAEGVNVTVEPDEANVPAIGDPVPTTVNEKELMLVTGSEKVTLIVVLIGTFVPVGAVDKTKGGVVSGITPPPVAPDDISSTVDPQPANKTAKNINVRHTDTGLFMPVSLSPSRTAHSFRRVSLTPESIIALSPRYWHCRMHYR